MPNLDIRTLLTTTCCLLSPAYAAASEEADLSSAASSYNYVEQTLQTYSRTGRIATGLGLDGADYAEFLEVLRVTRAEFSELFNSSSDLCKFYQEQRDSIEDDAQRARRAVEQLPSLSERRNRYILIDREFQDTIALLFGRFLLEDLNSAKLQTELIFQLPIVVWEDLEPLVFVAQACEE